MVCTEVLLCRVLVVCLTDLGACFGGHAECVALLLTFGADPGHKNMSGISARQDVCAIYYLNPPSF